MTSTVTHLDHETRDPVYTIVLSTEAAWRKADGRPGHCSFATYPIVGIDEAGRYLYETADARDVTATLDDAGWECAGTVKWDGCVNYQWRDGDVMLHACDSAELDRRHRSVAAAYRSAFVECGP